MASKTEQLLCQHPWEERLFCGDNAQVVNTDKEAGGEKDVPTAEKMANESDSSTMMDNMQRLERVVTIVVPIFFSVVVLVGFFGNLLVVLVVAFNRQMRNTTNMLILNLAVADILFIVFCVPFTATGYALPHAWPFGDTWWVLVYYYEARLVQLQQKSEM